MSDYYVVLNEEVKGPMDMFALEDLARAGVITHKTQLAASDSPDQWMQWKDLRPDYAGISSRPRAVAVSGSKSFALDAIPTRIVGALEPVRDKLRADTAYPILRQCVLALLIIAGVFLFISILALFNSDTRLLGVAGIAASLGSAFSTSILGVLLDIADAALRKIE